MLWDCFAVWLRLSVQFELGGLFTEGSGGHFTFFFLVRMAIIAVTAVKAATVANAMG